MREKIVILGVGSTYFTRSIVESLIRVGGSWDIGMVDIEPEPLRVAVKLGKRIAEMYKADVTITGSLDRRELLRGATRVVSVIGVGGRKAWMEDLLLGRRHGVYQTTADTAGIGGLSRALRTVPPLLAIGHDMEELCPDAILFNFTNPLSVNCRALTRCCSVKLLGLCTGVRHFHHALARKCGVEPSEVRCHAIGVNHFTWITRLTHGTKNLLEDLLDQARKGEVMPGGRLTTDLFQTFGAFPVVGDHHISEFIPNLLGENAYYGNTLGFEGTRDAAAEYFRKYDKTENEMRAQAEGSLPIEKKDLHDPTRQYSDESFFADMLLALRGDGPPMHCTVNLPNTGQASNLPPGAILESNVLVDADGVHPHCMGELPVGIAAIVQRIVAAQELVAEAAIRSDRRLAEQALLADLTARNLDEARAMVDDIVRTHRAYLPESLA